jgi:hypothetical protein
MKVTDVIYHYTNGFERICSAREIGTEKRFLYSSVFVHGEGWTKTKFSEEEEKSYRRFNNPLPLAPPEPDSYITLRLPVYDFPRETGTWKRIGERRLDAISN